MKTADRHVARWPTTAITVLVGGFVAVVLAAWGWSHVVLRERVDDVAMIIIAATALRVLTIAVSVAGIVTPPPPPTPPAPRLVNAGLAACAAAQLVYPAAEL